VWQVFNYQRQPCRPTGLQLAPAVRLNKIAHGSNNFQPLGSTTTPSGSNNTFGSTSTPGSLTVPKGSYQSRQHDHTVEPSPVPQYDHTVEPSPVPVRPHPVELSPVPAVTTQWSSHQSRQTTQWSSHQWQYDHTQWSSHQSSSTTTQWSSHQSCSTTTQWSSHQSRSTTTQWSSHQSRSTTTPSGALTSPGRYSHTQ